MRQVLGCIHAHRVVVRLHDFDSVAVLQDAQLLQRFAKFQRRLGPSSELEKEILPVCVQAEVLIDLGFHVPWVRNQRPGEVYGVADLVHDDLDRVWIVVLALVIQLSHQCGHLDGSIPERLDGALYRLRVDEGLVALDVKVDIGIGLPGDCGDAVSAALQVG